MLTKKKSNGSIVIGKDKKSYVGVSCPRYSRRLKKHDTNITVCMKENCIYGSTCPIHIDRRLVEMRKMMGRY